MRHTRARAPGAGELWEGLDETLWESLKRTQEHDPLRDARCLRCPHRAVFGAADPVVP
ncbi:hypothetical protein AB0B79_40915 [Streptomyces sp. NPDC039022]|uniref:hypothetical protein n=1 Tax=unclassified Streptomyces TaxID=2593676 RepID=UPI0034026EE5